MSFLPTKKTPRKTNPEDQTILIYGAAKIGKSTFASNADNPLFLATESGLNSLEVNQVKIDSWTKFLKVCGEIAKGSHKFKTIVIDTIDNLHMLCAQHILEKHNVEHEGDLGHGKGWSFVKKELMRALTKLTLLPYGLILISHDQSKTMNSRTGEYCKIIPTLQDSISKVILPICDIILHADIKETQDKTGKLVETRIIKTESSKYYDAGDRTGKLPAELLLDFTAFKKALNIKEK